MNWKTETIKARGIDVKAQCPIIISASRATDIPAFYSEWFVNRLREGYFKWKNPFSGDYTYFSTGAARLIVFWSKNPKPLVEKLDEIERLGFKNYYFQFTLNDYEAEGFEPNVPKLVDRIACFKELSSRIGKDRVVWRFDPLALSSKTSIDSLVSKIKRIGDEISPCTSKLVFSFLDATNAVRSRNDFEFIPFRSIQMEEAASNIGSLCGEWGIGCATCAEGIDLEKHGVRHNRCIDDELMVKCFSHDKELMDFIGAEYIDDNELFDVKAHWEIPVHKKDKGQRLQCGCIMSKDIGEYSTCMHMCRYCYANKHGADVVVNWKKHCSDPLNETIV